MPFLWYILTFVLTSVAVVSASVTEQLATPPSLSQSILGETDVAPPPLVFSVNVPAIFSRDITAPNVVYSLTPGAGISVSEGQTPTITNTGVTSLQGETGELELVEGSGISLDGLKITNTGILALSAGSGISVSGSTITNSDLGSSQSIFKTVSVSGQSDVVADSNSDTLTLVAGSGLTITTSASGDSVTITPNDPSVAAGWTHTSGLVALTTSSDSVSIGGGLNVNSSGITNAGSITGATGFTSSGTITLADLSTGIVHANVYGVLSSSAVALGSSDVTGVLGATNGGTGLSSYTTGDLIYASATNVLSKLGAGGNGEVLTMSGGVPDWATISSGDPCPTCLVNNPGSDQAITPSAGTGLIVKKASSGTSDIFKVTSSDGLTAYLKVESDGDVLLGNGQTTQGVFTVSPTGTHPITLSPASYSTSAYTGTMTTSDLTAARTWTFPDASGIVCTTSGNCSGSSSALGGSGTTNYLSKWSSTYALANSLLYDTGTNVGIGTTSPGYKLDVIGTASVSGNLSAGTNLTVVGSAAVGSTLNVTGAVDLASTLGVTGATTLQSTLGVTGNATFNGQITAPKVNKVIVVDGNIYPQTCAGINSAIDALGSSGGEIYLPQGTYTCSETIDIDADNTFIHGAGDSTHIDGSGMYAGSGKIFFLDGYDNLVIKDMKITGNYSANSSDSTVFGSWPGYSCNDTGGVCSSDYSLIENLNIINSGYDAIVMRYADHSQVRNNTITTPANFGIYFNDNNYNDIISSNKIYSAGGYGIYVNGMYNSQVTDNYVEGTVEGTTVRMTISATDTLINGNILNGTGYGVDLSGTRNTFTNNRLVNSTYELMRLSGNNHIISNNYFYDDATTRYGINVSSTSTGVRISNNYFIGFNNASSDYGTAIKLSSNASNYIIANNTFSGNRTNINENSATGTSYVYEYGNNLSLGTLDNSPDGSLEIIKQSTTPLLMLSSSADANGDYFFVGNTGLVGIGTTNPTMLLDIAGNATLRDRSAGTDTSLQIYTAGSNNKTYIEFAKPSGGWANWRVGQVISSNNDFGITKADQGGAYFTLSQAGLVGIGTTAPTSKLHVTGAVTGKALAIFDETGNQNIFTASGSGTTRLSLSNSGQLTSYGSIYTYGTNDGGTGTGLISINNSGGLDLSVVVGSGAYITARPSYPLFITSGTLTISSGTSDTYLKQNSVNVLTSEGSGAVVNTLYLKAGKVGIGTTNPDNTLVLGGLANSVNGIKFSTSAIELGATTGYSNRIAVNTDGKTLLYNAGYNSSSTYGHIFYADYNAELMRIMGGPHVGIGTTNPEGMFNVRGAVTGKALAIFDETGNQDILVASASGTNRFVVKNDGKVGIGTTSPPNILSVYSTTNADGLSIDGTTNPAINFKNSGTVKSYIGLVTADGGYISDSATNDLIIRSENNNILFGRGGGPSTLAIVGNSVGIGTTAPTSKLHVSGAVTGKALAIFDETGNQALLTASASGVTKFLVNNSGYVGIGTTSLAEPLNIGFSDSSGAISGLKISNTNTSTSKSYAGMLLSAQNGTVTGDFTAVPTSSTRMSGGGIIFRTTTNHHLGFSTNDTLWMRLSNTGKLYIANPDDTVTHIGNSISTNGHYSGVSIGYNETNGLTYAKSAIVQEQLGDAAARGKIHFLNDGTADNSNANLSDARLTIDYNGLIGIGTTAPTGKLHVSGAVTGKALTIFNETGNQALLTASASGVTKFTVGNDGTITTTLGTGTVYSNAGALTNTDPSDLNLKQNILSLGDGTLGKVLGLRAVSYEWKRDGKGALGFIAQEVQEVFPELVGSNADGTLGLYTTQFIPVLAKAIQEQQLEIDEIKLSSASASISNAEWAGIRDLVASLKGKIDQLISSVTDLTTRVTKLEEPKDSFCVTKSDNSELCVTSDQLEQLLQILPSPTASASATPTPTLIPDPTSSPSATPTI